MRFRERDRPVPHGATEESDLAEFVDARIDNLEEHLLEIAWKLRQAQHSVDFDIPFKRVAVEVERSLEGLLAAGARTRQGLCELAALAHPSQATWWVRPLVNDPEQSLRNKARGVLKRIAPRDRFIPGGRGQGHLALEMPHRPLTRHTAGSQARVANGVADWATVADMRVALGLQPSQLRYLLVASDSEYGDVEPPYVVRTIPKRSGGTRKLCIPNSHLRSVQRKLLRLVFEPVPVHDAAHGFVKGRSVKTHAALHTKKRLVIGFDLVDFFGSVHYFRLVGLLASLGYDVAESIYSSEDGHRGVAETIARLCIYSSQPHRLGGTTPQGAPTSPQITNLICRRLDSRLSGLADKLGGAYSRYADDLTFSFDRDPSGGVGRFRWWVDAICHQEGFQVHRGKFRVFRQSQAQRVTGVVVNDAVHVSRRDMRRFRAIVHNCEKHGVASQARGNPAFRSWLSGYAAWIHAVDPLRGGPLVTRVKSILAAEGTTP